MKFGSVCSGIEAASVAWHPLGWEAAWLSEIEPFPCAVLKHHYPDVPNHGDMTLLPEKILSGEVEAPDLFCGGTPCQAFSVAGLRNSLDDARGNLSLTFVGIANAIDHVRSVRRDAPAIIFWENVPGVLNTKDNAFGCFLGALAGESDQIFPPGEKWSNAGCVFGPTRTVAWRVLDAQYFGVAQRRKRVFVVASARDDINPTEILFESEGVRRDSAPSREAGKDVTVFTPGSIGGYRPGAGTLRASGGDLGGGSEHLITQPYKIGNTLTARMHKGMNSDCNEGQTPVLQPSYAIQGSMIGRNDNAGPQGDGINVEVCFTQNTIDRHAVAQPIPLNTMALQGRPGDTTGRMGSGIGKPGDPCPTLTKAHSHAVLNPAVFAPAEVGPTMGSSGPPYSRTGNERVETDALAIHHMQVRRLTPVECERLQGFPDGYTNIPWRKASEAPDGPRYKALGNSWAVPVVFWIGKRIQEQIDAA